MRQVQKNSFLSYILSDQVLCCNIKRLLGYFKNCICKFMQASSWHTNYSTSICPFVSGKSRKKWKQLLKFKYVENEKSFFDETKSTFHIFGRAISWWKKQKFDKKWWTQALSMPTTPNFEELSKIEGRIKLKDSFCF